MFYVGSGKSLVSLLVSLYRPIEYLLYALGCPFGTLLFFSMKLFSGLVILRKKKRSVIITYDHVFCGK